ncbi:MAG: hypothetical protein QNJ89_08475 [Acidimicrobiia bacterium]|nr:hypothetical protein [Acidimicrobiia bacterium]
MRLFAALLTIAFVASGCASPAANDTVPVTDAIAPTTTSTAPPATTQPENSTADPPCLAGDRPFSTSGVISAFGGAAGDAMQISGIRTGFYAECERVVVDLLTADGAPAGSLGLVGVEYDAAIGIVRINLPLAVTRTAIADLRLDGELADRAYLVDTVAGNLALDIHVAPGSRVALRAFEVASPSRIVVDFKPEPNAPAARGANLGDQLVVTHPIAGTSTPPLQVAGYARSSSSPIEATLHDVPEGPAVSSVAATTTSSTDTWNEFELEFSNPPRGMVYLQVLTPTGDDSPVWLSVDMGPVDDLDESDT